MSSCISLLFYTLSNVSNVVLFLLFIFYKLASNKFLANPSSVLFKATLFIYFSSSSSQSPSDAKINFEYLSLNSNEVIKGLWVMYGPVKTANFVKLYYLNFK